MNDNRRSTSPLSAPATRSRSSAGTLTNEEGIPREAIAQRAYELYAASGFQHGRDVENWLEAERQLRKDPKYR